MCPSKRAKPLQVSGGVISQLLLGEVEIKLDQISSAWLLPAQP